MKNKAFYWTGLVCGSLTLSVGVGIFLLWWGARAFFAVSLTKLEVAGLSWIGISAPIGLIGLIASAIAAGSGENRHWFKDALPFLIVLANIPALWIILVLQSNIDERMYFELRNTSRYIIENVSLESASFSNELGRLKPGSTMVNFYVPKYLEDWDSMPVVEEVTVTFKTIDGSVERTMPYALMGWCQRIVVTDSLTLTQ
ncbi:MAG: hypothetical protein RIF36_24985 [Imperialibacter sp.]|uniref:hypothetical protein n=1 Tax=Imperialibacter sp. TaxID=2038411 RepID=UPI0032EF7FC0